MICCLSLILEISWSLLVQVSVWLLSPFSSYFNDVCYILCNCLTVLRYSVSFFIFFYFHYYWEVSTDTLPSSRILCSTMSSLLKSPLKAYFISLLLQYFLLIPFPFDSFLEFPHLCLYYPSILSCCLLFPLQPLILLISYFKFSV